MFQKTCGAIKMPSIHYLIPQILKYKRLQFRVRYQVWINLNSTGWPKESDPMQSVIKTWVRGLWKWFKTLFCCNTTSETTSLPYEYFSQLSAKQQICKIEDFEERAWLKSSKSRQKQGIDSQPLQILETTDLCIKWSSIQSEAHIHKRSNFHCCK